MKHSMILVFKAAALLLIAASSSVLAQGQRLPTTPRSNPNLPTDLRSAMSQMQFKDGSNVIYNQGGLQIVARGQGGDITGWTVTSHGKPLRTEMKRGGNKCQICFVFDDGSWHCVYVDCRSRPPLPKKAQ